MLPQSANLDDLVLDFETGWSQNTKTFAINLDKNAVGGQIDGLNAIRQTIYLLLNIEADQHIIYPYTHGIKTLDLIGMPSHYVEAVIPGRIKDALLSDERITDVTDFEFETIKNKLLVTFVVHTIYGNTTENVGVSY